MMSHMAPPKKLRGTSEINGKLRGGYGLCR